MSAGTSFPFQKERDTALYWADVRMGFYRALERIRPLRMALDEQAMKAMREGADDFETLRSFASGVADVEMMLDQMHAKAEALWMDRRDSAALGRQEGKP